ncbi:hypothetical protein OsJ_02111 [Oryza sativa Japonica Group]|uniref:Disease resistance N-terminal domain-containing protein n=1 Tax=Oryza sativa subsp. japonica TaxID=39947 RepID=A2ZU28_ORYSJ|nr:hypothetical protein OsJ_02111 [Oryza sativa Japonica Group]
MERERMESTILPRLALLLEHAERTIPPEQKQLRTDMEQWACRLRSAFYDIEDILDLADYNRLENKVGFFPFFSRWCGMEAGDGGCDVDAACDGDGDAETTRDDGDSADPVTFLVKNGPNLMVIPGDVSGIQFPLTVSFNKG